MHKMHIARDKKIEQQERQAVRDEESKQQKHKHKHKHIIYK